MGATPAILIAHRSLHANPHARRPASDCNRSSQFFWQRLTTAAITVFRRAATPRFGCLMSHLVATTLPRSFYLGYSTS